MGRAISIDIVLSLSKPASECRRALEAVNKSVMFEVGVFFIAIVQQKGWYTVEISPAVLLI